MPGVLRLFAAVHTLQARHAARVKGRKGINGRSYSCALLGASAKFRARNSVHRPMPPPKPDATFNAVSQSKPSDGANAGTTACEQVQPCLKQATASSTLVMDTLQSSRRKVVST